MDNRWYHFVSGKNNPPGVFKIVLLTNNVNNADASCHLVDEHGKNLRSLAWSDCLDDSWSIFYVRKHAALAHKEFNDALENLLK